TDARGGEIEAGRAAEAARADQEHARLEQLQLSLDADLWDQQVPAVPRALLSVEGARQLRREAVALPVGEAAGERDDVLVAELAKRLRAEHGAVAGRAVDDDRLGVVGRCGFDAGLEIPARDVDRAGDLPLVPL